MRVCVTGASGFVASAFLRRLKSRKYESIALSSSDPNGCVPASRWFVRDISSCVEPLHDIGPIDVLVHLAGRAHVMRERDADPAAEYRRINVEMTERLVLDAAAKGVKRFLFVSTIGVHGDAQGTIQESTPINPVDLYAQSKYEAELRLREITETVGMELVIIRPALVAGAAAPGNLRRLAEAISRGFPFPVPARGNARSFVGLNNLAELIFLCLDHPAAAGEVFVAAEAEWPSTRQVIEWIAEGMNRRARIIVIPFTLMKGVSSVLGKSAMYEKVFGDLRVDAAKARDILGWCPVESLADAVRLVGKEREKSLPTADLGVHVEVARNPVLFRACEAIDRPGMLITGAAGFIGSALIERIARESFFRVLPVVREPVQLSSRIDPLVMGELTSDSDWEPSLHGVDVVLHLAGRIPLRRDSSTSVSEAEKRVVESTLHMARKSAKAGVRRFVFLSSVKVNGEVGIFSELDIPDPQDSYAVSKYRMEMGLQKIASESGMEVVIVRSPLVYGHGVKGNFRALMRAVDRGIPLPFAAIHNRRSLIALDNLVDFMIACIDHPAAANQVFMVSDGEDLSTPDLIRRLAQAMGRPARLFAVSPALLISGARTLGREKMAQRLIFSLQVNSEKSHTVLGWKPCITVDEGIVRAARRGGVLLSD